MRGNQRRGEATHTHRKKRACAHKATASFMLTEWKSWHGSSTAFLGDELRGDAEMPGAAREGKTKSREATAGQQLHPLAASKGL